MNDISRIVLEEIRQDEIFRNDSGLSDDDLLGAPLLGKGSKMDSVGLVSLIFGVEERIQTELGVSVQIASESAVSQSRSPFRTVGSFVTFTSDLVKQAQKANG